MLAKHCPKCQGAMRLSAFEQRVPVSQCEGCSGIWLDSSAADRHLAESRPGRSLVRTLAAMNPAPSARSGYRCTACAEDHLYTHVHRGIEIDWCPACKGIYLDDGELARVARGRAVRSAQASQSGPGFWESLGAVVEVAEAILMLLDVVVTILDLFDD